MNFMCLYCQSVRTAARVRGGGAVALFRCDQSGQESVYLLPGEPMACLARRGSNDAEPAVSTKDQSEAHDEPR